MVTLLIKTPSPSNTFLYLLLLGQALLVSPSNQAHTSAPFNIFILAGQSNMSGRGGIVNQTRWNGVIPPECQSNRSILRLNAAYSWGQAHEPLHQDIDDNVTCGIGPGMPFAHYILEKSRTHVMVGLIPCAVGGTRGTSISQWAKGTDLYNQLVRRARMALPSGGIIRALLWYQGESDTVSLEEAQLYKGRLEKFFTDVRVDLKSPMLPIIQVALASSIGPYIEIVRKAQFEINLPNVSCVDAKGLPLNSDKLHLSTPGEIRLGKMLALAYLQTVPSFIQGINNNSVP